MTGDVEAFLSRLVRLDPAALARVRPDTAGRVAVWGRVPWDVLVSRTLDGFDREVGDVTVRAADWLAAGGGDPSGLRRMDMAWRTPLPGAGARVVETVPVAVLRNLGEAAARTLRETEAGGLGRAVGARMLRDALLDHVAIEVTADGGELRVDVPQRLVQAVVRMGFLGPGKAAGDAAGASGGAFGGGEARVIHSGRWVGVAAPFGVAWWRRPGEFSVTPMPVQRR